MSMLIILALLWGAGIWVLNRDLDRERQEREKAARKKALEKELREVHSAAYLEDGIKRFHWSQDREISRQLWGIRLGEAKHELYVRRLRKQFEEAS